jgi:hypothetical protein
MLFAGPYKDVKSLCEPDLTGGTHSGACCLSRHDVRKAVIKGLTARELIKRDIREDIKQDLERFTEEATRDLGDVTVKPHPIPSGLGSSFMDIAYTFYYTPEKAEIILKSYLALLLNHSPKHTPTCRLVLVDLALPQG